MNIIANDEGRVAVTLSRRNLETLIKMLDRKTGISAIRRQTESGTSVWVHAEENDAHYGEPVPGIGPEDVF